MLPKLPRRATGTAHPSGRRKRIDLSPKEMDAIVCALPARTRDGQPLRAYFEVMRETGLRPGTLQRLHAPDDYRPGSRFLRIRAEADKARYARELPLPNAHAKCSMRCAPPRESSSRSSLGVTRFGQQPSPPAWSPTAHRTSSPTTFDTASRPSSPSAQAIFSASAICSDTVTRPPPTSTFTRVEARPSRSFWDNIWDKSTASAKDTGTPPALTPRHHFSARDRTRTCTP